MPRDADLLPASPEPALALWLTQRTAAEGTLLYIAHSDARLDRLARAAAGFAAGAVEILVLPAWDVLPYDRSAPSAGVVGRRVAALARLGQPADRPRLVMTSADAALRRVRPPGAWRDTTLVLSLGDTLDLGALRIALAERGYHLDERVADPGEVALRGHVIDVFPTADDAPARLEIDEGRIVAIHRFDPATQRSGEALDRVTLYPAIEVLLAPEAIEDAAEALAHPDGTTPGDAAPALADAPSLVPLFRYLPRAAIVLDDDVPDRWQDAADQIEDAFAAAARARRVAVDANQGVLPPRPAQLYLTPPQALRAVHQHRVPAEPTGRPVPVPHRVDALVAEARDAIACGDAVVIACPSDPGRVAASLGRRGLDVRVAVDWADAASGDGVACLTLDIAEGFAQDGVLVLPIAGLMRHASAAAASLGPTDDAPRIGDVVVHLDHGVARLTGLREVEAAGTVEERAALAFADGAELLVPASELDRIWRYGTDAEVSLDRMGGEAWRRKRAEIEAGIADTARHLSEQAAARAARAAPAIEPPRPDYDRLARRFAYALSPDQRVAVNAVLADLARGIPMDRLVCGDVGFGKTEVALRAAAAVVLAGYQVAVVAPTTVLARQHLDSFRRRFAGTGVRVEGLIRSGTSPEGRTVREGLADSSVHIVVGTQAIASEGVRFARLGLVVIDEEQRFGEAHKAKLGGLTSEAGAVHTLVMTATPIPRTMQSALVGLREVSVIATPPVRRQPTRTFALPFDPVVVREALLREHRRGGQSFVVCPRIADIGRIEDQLREIVPELSVVTAHGRMAAEALETAVVGFAEGKGDVLLATDIIEAGLDIPRANTVLVTSPDRFGLAQLHQLRGRVGRGARRGSAYLLTEPGRTLTAATRARLHTLEALSGLGAGVAISAADLDRRGAGDLFGDAQAGHLSAIGTELYQHLLAEAVARQRGEPSAPPPPDLQVGLTGRIPADYVPEAHLRLSLYRRLAGLTDPADLTAFEHELHDRFGPLPEELAGLLQWTRLRCWCARLGVARLAAGPQGAALTPQNPDAANDLAARLGGHVRAGRVLLDVAVMAARQRVARLMALLSATA